jgi:hypothetical protein
MSTSTYIDRLPPQDEERLRSLGQEPRELVYQNVLNLIRLLYPYADTHAVHRRLDEDTLLLVPRNGQWVEDEFGRGIRLDFGNIVPFAGLRCEVGKREGGGQGAAYAGEVGSE